MNSLFTVGILVLSLTASGQALYCTVCSGSSPNNCFGSSTEKCSSSKHVCLSIYETTLSGTGASTSTFVRKCEQKSLCGKSGVFNYYEGKARFSTSCCDTNYCTPYEPNLPAYSYVSNGKTCPYCVSFSSTDCKGSYNMMCMGDEYKCVHQTTEISGTLTQKTAVRGCGSNSYCDLGTITSEYAGLKTKVKFKCSNGVAVNGYSALTLLMMVAASLIQSFF
ncbi:phospholipase A2 inhibitor gamma subunit B-like [Hyperolius riggenbachi]|uniref:phospholipase A2 inhibitor gamma subunit B-like n=1 Tax=Hyperolius riggenbachi TaxID=752182 RepID=UPI0035A2D5B7